MCCPSRSSPHRKQRRQQARHQQGRSHSLPSLHRSGSSQKIVLPHYIRPASFVKIFFPGKSCLPCARLRHSHFMGSLSSFRFSQELTNSAYCGILALPVRKDWSEGYCHYGRRLSYILREEVLRFAYIHHVPYFWSYREYTDKKQKPPPWPVTVSNVNLKHSLQG